MDLAAIFIGWFIRKYPWQSCRNGNEKGLSQCHKCFTI